MSSAALIPEEAALAVSGRPYTFLDRQGDEMRHHGVMTLVTYPTILTSARGSASSYHWFLPLQQTTAWAAVALLMQENRRRIKKFPKASTSSLFFDCAEFGARGRPQPTWLLFFGLQEEPKTSLSLYTGDFLKRRDNFSSVHLCFDKETGIFI